MLINNISKRLLILMGLCCLCVMPLMAQDAEAGFYQEALGRIEAARVSRKMVLDLSGLSLERVPPEIGQLKNLQELYLYNNRLKILPSEIGQLKNLQKLNLHSNSFTTLPLEIGQLTNLQELNLYNNQLATLPPEIGQLLNLQTLYLHNNRLTTLPPEIGQLSNLQDLIISNNQLITLPPEFEQLKQLEYIELNGNPIRLLPIRLLPIGVQSLPAIQSYILRSGLFPQLIVGITAGVVGIVALILAFRWRQRRAWSEKKKRM